MKIWFLTRSLYPYQKTGGGQIREGQVSNLKALGWEVSVIMPNYLSDAYIEKDEIIQIPFNDKDKLIYLLLKLGIYEDYMDGWVKKAFLYLKNRIKIDDIVFTTSGGEPGMVKLGFLLKKYTGCNFIVNFHDPLSYTLVNGIKDDEGSSRSRDKQEKKYLSGADLIITSSVSNKISLQNKYPQWSNKVRNNYFGYIKSFEVLENIKKDSKKLRIAYAGSFQDTQKPESLYYAYLKIKDKINIEIYFIGNSKEYEPLSKVNDENIIFINYLPHDKFMHFMIENIDVGYVSLAKDYFGACVPSKIFEYINLGLPILGALPYGDGYDIINTNNYGISTYFNDIDGISNAIIEFKARDNLSKYRYNIKRDKDLWSMSNRILDVQNMIKDLVDKS